MRAFTVATCGNDQHGPEWKCHKVVGPDGGHPLVGSLPRNLAERIATALTMTENPNGDAPVVILESPFAGNVDRNIAYAQAALRDCLLRGEAPFASHLLYTQPGVLRDGVPEERDHGIQAGFAFRKFAVRTVVYADLGYSHGMKLGIEHARKLGQPVEVRALEGWGPKHIPRVDLPIDGCGR